jgi:quercetin dioxygenase-like cupin family protein
MSRFSKVNLLEVEDSVAGRVEGLEGRFGRKHLDSRDLGISLFRYAPNLRSPTAHSHKEQEEAYVVVAGSGRILLDDETQELRRWDVVRVAPEVVRAFEAGPDGLDIIAVGGPSPRKAMASARPRPGLAPRSHAGRADRIVAWCSTSYSGLSARWFGR